MTKSKGNAAKARPVLTDAEWDILKVVWQHQPCAAGTVQEALAASRNWAYSTVKTTMDRMAKKNLLRVEHIRNLQLFSANISEQQAQRGEVMKTLKRAFDGALTPMVQFLLEDEQFSAKELGQLRKLIEEAKGSEK